MDINDLIISSLLSLKDEQYRDFHSALMPTVKKEKIIGVRVPHLRKLAKEIYKNHDISPFFNKLPHKYYEENNLHAFFIEQIKDFDECVSELDKFLPFVDNWATCDMMTPKVLRKNTKKLYKKIKEWLTSPDIYTVRFAIRMLMVFYLGELFTDEIFELVLNVDSDEYYLKMMVAWFFATAAVTRYDYVKKILKSNHLDRWTHNKTISKCVDSYRLTKKQKDELKELRRLKD